VDIEEFYDADERRRSSAELELGTDWRDDHGIRHELNWVEDTGELYVVREPVPRTYATPFGGVHVTGTHAVDETEVEGMTVVVVGQVEARAVLESALEGWEDAIGQPDSIAWLVDRLRGHGILDPQNPSTSYPT
jgi:hypothetical protein